LIKIINNNILPKFPVTQNNIAHTKQFFGKEAEKRKQNNKEHYPVGKIGEIALVAVKPINRDAKHVLVF